MTAEPEDVPVSVPTARSGGYIGMANLLGRGVDRLMAFGQIVLVAYAFGASNGADLFFLAGIVPLTIGFVVGEPLGRAFLTMLLSQEREVPADELAAGGMLVTAVVVTAVTGIYLAVALPLVGWLHPDGQAALGPWIAFAPLGIVIGTGAYLGALLVWQERYLWAAARFPVGGTLALLLMGAAVHYTNGINTVAAAVTIGYTLALVPLFAAVGAGLGSQWPTRATRRALRATWSGRRRLAAAVGGGLIGGQIVVLLERLFAAPLGLGAVSSLSYARGVAGAPALVSEASSAGAYPGFARAASVRDYDFLRDSFFVWFRVTMIAGIAFAVYFGLFGHDVIALLFERGRFGVNDSTRAGSILVAFALSTVASAAVALFVTLLYGLDSFVGILYREIAVLTVYLVAAPLLRAADGVVGLAWAFSAAQSVGAVLAGVLVFRRLAIGRRGLAVDGLAPLAVPVGALALGLLLARISLDRVAGDPSLRAAVGAGTVAVVGGAILARSPLPEARRVRRVARRRD